MLLSKVFDRQQAGIEQDQEENRRLAELQVRQQMVGRGFFAVVQTFFAVTPAAVYLVADSSSRAARPLFCRDDRGVHRAPDAAPLPGRLAAPGVNRDPAARAFERVFQYLDLEHDIVDAPDAVTLPRDEVVGRIDFRDVSFRYDEPGFRRRWSR